MGDGHSTNYAEHEQDLIDPGSFKYQKSVADPQSSWRNSDLPLHTILYKFPVMVSKSVLTYVGIVVQLVVVSVVEHGKFVDEAS